MSRRNAAKSPSAPAGAVWLWGRHAVAAALANPRRPCLRLVATAPALERLGPLARRPGLSVEPATAEAISRLVGTAEVHQGLALAVGPLPPLSLDEVLRGDGPSLVLALDQVTDPRNFGAILRSAAAFAVDAVLVPERRSAAASGAAARAAAGGLDLVPLVEVVNLARALGELQARGYWVVGLDGGAAATIDALPDFARLVLVLGAEGHGLRRLVAERCDRLARIPIAPNVESLNVAVAAGIAMFALGRQRAAGGSSTR
jgi:23S rRNA (guanosine2251-2'-O)-methyltransferase